MNRLALLPTLAITATLAFAVVARADDLQASSPEADALPVPSMTIYPGDTIDDAMLADQPFAHEVAQNGTFAVSRRALVGKVARRTLLPGKPIPLGGVADPEIVRRGVPIQVSYEAGALEISTVAMPLQSGSIGARIQLRNTDSGRVIIGVVQADGSARVGEP